MDHIHSYLPTYPPTHLPIHLQTAVPAWLVVCPPGNLFVHLRGKEIFVVNHLSFNIRVVFCFWFFCLLFARGELD